MNTLSNLQREQLLSLIADYCDGTIEASAGEQLEAILQSSEPARALYVEYLDLHLALSKYARSMAIRNGQQKKVQSAGAAPAILPIQTRSVRSAVLGFLDRVGGYARQSAIAATLLVAAALYGSFGFVVWQMSRYELHQTSRHDFSSTQEFSDSGNAEIVARLIGDRSCRWSTDSHSPRLYDELPAGELNLIAGEAEIEFADGARVTLFAPCTYELVKSNGSFLSSGRMLANVPKSAIGFFVNTPSANVIDLGTEFGVDVDSTGATEVHVLRGIVETTPLLAGVPTDRKPVRLTAGEGLQVNPRTAEVAPLVADGARFASRDIQTTGSKKEIHTYADALLADRPLAFWPLSEASGAKTVADLSGNGHTGMVRGAVEFGIPGPISKSAITTARFDGASWIEIAKPEPLALTEDFTVEAWLRPEPDSEIGRVLSVDPGNNDRGWGFGWLPRKRLGNVEDGILFTLYGVKDYRLDRQPWPTDQGWHHVAIVCDRIRNAHLFIDGKWSGMVEGQQRGIAGAVQAAIGRQTNGTQSYRGGLAQVAIYPRALDERQILRHFGIAADPAKLDHPTGQKQPVN